MSRFVSNTTGKFGVSRLSLHFRQSLNFVSASSDCGNLKVRSAKHFWQTSGYRRRTSNKEMDEMDGCPG